MGTELTPSPIKARLTRERLIVERCVDTPETYQDHEQLFRHHIILRQLESTRQALIDQRSLLLLDEYMKTGSMYIVLARAKTVEPPSDDAHGSFTLCGHGNYNTIKDVLSDATHLATTSVDYEYV